VALKVPHEFLPAVERPGGGIRPHDLTSIAVLVNLPHRTMDHDDARMSIEHPGLALEKILSVDIIVVQNAHILALGEFQQSIQVGVRADITVIPVVPQPRIRAVSDHGCRGVG
jgi:hypothetical protein